MDQQISGVRGSCSGLYMHHVVSLDENFTSLYTAKSPSPDEDQQ